MPLSKEARIERLTQIREGKDDYGKKEVLWNYGQAAEGSMELMRVYKIPIDHLIYNQRNGRILSRTLSYEANNRKIDAQSDNGNELIEDFLLESNVPKNRKTEVDIRKFGQKEVGIVTLDGIVIDGNRRLMILNRIVNNPEKLDISNFNTFKGVILPATLQDAFKEIKRLETIYQMGEDEKAGYNAIEKYLQAKELFELGWTKKDIASFMNRTEVDITKLKKTMEIMELYLETYEYDSQYTQLDKREDYFLHLNTWLESFRGTQSEKGHDGYNELDVDLLQAIAFDYIRCYKALDDKDFRRIAGGLKSNHIFGDKKIWGEFSQFHNDSVFPLRSKEPEINHEIDDMMSHLNDRDIQFLNQSKKFLKDNFKKSIQKLAYRKSHDKPAEQIENIDSIADGINPKGKSFHKPQTQKQLGGVVNKLQDLMDQAGNTSKLYLLKRVIKLLKRILGTLTDEDLKDGKILKETTEVSSLAHKIKKEAGG